MVGRPSGRQNGTSPFLAGEELQDPTARVLIHGRRGTEFPQGCEKEKGDRSRRGGSNCRGKNSSGNKRVGGQTRDRKGARTFANTKGGDEGRKQAGRKVGHVCTGRVSPSTAEGNSSRSSRAWKRGEEKPEAGRPLGLGTA